VNWQNDKLPLGFRSTNSQVERDLLFHTHLKLHPIPYILYLVAYHSWDKITIDDFSNENIEALYEKGYVFTRTGRGNMNQTRSIRVDLSKFELSSENRRILTKIKGTEINVENLPLPPEAESYRWRIAKMAKDFYDKKFGKGVFSANKVRELLTSKESNFNLLMTYVWQENRVAYAICFGTKNILHYSYPFYVLEGAPTNAGMGMMLMALLLAKEEGDKYVYLGSATRPGDIYKLQFKGLEYYDKDRGWTSNLDSLKSILKTA